MERIILVNQNPHEFQSCCYDFSLPTTYHYYGMAMLNARIKPNSPENQIVKLLKLIEVK